MVRTNSELDMLAEKAALLGRREADEEPNSPMEELRSRSPTSIRSAAQLPIFSGDLRDSNPLSVTSPMYDLGEPEVRPQPLSEKARGKMRATDSATSLASLTGDAPEIPDEELMKVASSGVGPNGYIPTQDWVSSWQKGYVACVLRGSYQQIATGSGSRRHFRTFTENPGFAASSWRTFLQGIQHTQGMFPLGRSPT